MPKETQSLRAGSSGPEGKLVVSRHHMVSALLLAMLSVLAGGCIVGPDYARPDLPFSLENFIANEETGNPDPTGYTAADIHSWWENLNDPMLNQLLVQARNGNPSLQEAIARIEQASARIDVATAPFWPQVEHSSGYSRRRIAPGASSQIGRRSGDPFDSYTFDIRASWELDLFGRIQRGIEAAEARAVSQEENYHAVLVSLLADVATNYVDMRVLQHRLAIAKVNLDVQRKNMQLAETRRKAGLVGMLDVKQAETVVRTTEASIPRLEEQIRLRQYRLAILTGEPPSHGFVTRLGSGNVPVPTVGIQPGIPAHLVAQRPDIRLAEAELHAATADIGVVEGELYPQITLVGNPSFDTSRLGDLYREQSFGYSVGPSFRWDIITMGRTRANIAATEAAARQAELRFRSAVLSAIEEVEAGAFSYRKARERVDMLTKAVDAASESVQLSESTYQVGNSSFLRVVEAQRQLLQSQDQLASAYGEAVIAWIRTYRALGGGWDPTAQACSVANEVAPEGQQGAPPSGLSAPKKPAAPKQDQQAGNSGQAELPVPNDPRGSSSRTALPRWKHQRSRSQRPVAKANAAANNPWSHLRLK